MDRMETAFEHDDLRLALELKPAAAIAKPLAKATAKPRSTPKGKAQKDVPSQGKGMRSKKAIAKPAASKHSRSRKR